MGGGWSSSELFPLSRFVISGAGSSDFTTSVSETDLKVFVSSLNRLL
jgi:hypothetical protein